VCVQKGEERGRRGGDSDSGRTGSVRKPCFWACSRAPCMSRTLYSPPQIFMCGCRGIACPKNARVLRPIGTRLSRWEVWNILQRTASRASSESSTTAKLSSSTVSPSFEWLRCKSLHCPCKRIRRSVNLERDRQQQVARNYRFACIAEAGKRSHR
jgi:hypothetical protein